MRALMVRNLKQEHPNCTAEGMPFEWLIPIQKGLPALKAEYETARTSYSGSAEEKTAAIADIKTNGWRYGTMTEPSSMQ
jgi:hypothetical protein